MRLHILLMGLLNAEPNDSINNQIAVKMFENIDEMKSMSLTRLAKLCNVSKATVSRFIRTLGYSDFLEMRYDMRKGIDLETVLRMSAYPTDKDYMNQVVKNSAKLLKENVSTKLDRLAGMLDSYDNIVLMGHAQCLPAAYLLQQDLMNYHKVSQVIAKPLEQAEFFETVKKPSLVLIFSVSGNFFAHLYDSGKIPVLPDGSALCMITTNCKKSPSGKINFHLDLATGHDFAAGNMTQLTVERLLMLHYDRFQKAKKENE